MSFIKNGRLTWIANFAISDADSFIQYALKYIGTAPLLWYARTVFYGDYAFGSIERPVRRINSVHVYVTARLLWIGYGLRTLCCDSMLEYLIFSRQISK